LNARKKLKDARVALVFDWMTTAGGAEKVNLQLHKIFPEADIFTSIYNPEKVKGFESANIKTSFIQKLPFSKTKHQLYLTLMPYAYESFDFRDYDIVISSSHSCAKGIITKVETLHICYCHTPMRYAWDNWQQYIEEYKMNGFLKKIAKKQMHKLRIWDKISAERVDHYIANSKITSKRIKKYYRKNSEIIHPSINSENFHISEKPENYYLAVGRLIPYKKFELIIEAFNKTGLQLKIAGTGVAEEELKAKANSNIEFLGYVSDKKLRELYSNCQALIFPQVEDFGITPLEAMSSGRPVIAYAEGGALDTIIDGKTGILFEEQSPEGLIDALERFQDIKGKLNPTEIKKHADNFDNEKFRDQIVDYIEQKWDLWKS